MLSTTAILRRACVASLPLLVFASGGCSEAAGSNTPATTSGRSMAGGRDASRTTLVVVEPLVRGPVRDEVIVSAKVATRTSVTIFPKLSGLAVTMIAKEEGDAVAAGELLLSLFDTDLQLAVQTAEAALEEANGTVERSELTVEEGKQRVKSAERSAAKSADDLMRLSGLGDLVNRKEVDDARLAADKAADELDLQRFSERSSHVSLDLAKIALRKAEIEAERAKTSLEYTQIRSPTSGVVAERHISMGELVNAGTSIFTIVDTADLVLNLRVPQDSLARLQRDQPVDVLPVTGAGTVFHGVVRTVNPVLDQATGTVRVTVDLEAAEGLVPGLFCEAHIVTAARNDALLVSKRAVIYEDDQPVLFAIDTRTDATDAGVAAVGGAEATEVRVRKILFRAGASTSSQVELLGDAEGVPLPADLRVVVVGQENLKDGATVKVVEEAF